MQAQVKERASGESTKADSFVRTKPHIICISDLIIHKYSESALLKKKADGVALAIISEDLRSGEYVRAAKPGVYHIFLPMLRSDAAELRCAVLRDRIFRAIRELNPAAKAHIDGGGESPTSLEDGRKRSHANQGSGLQADHAIQLMTRALASRDELLRSPLGQFLAERAVVSLTPVFYSEKNLIAGHAIVLTLGKSRLTSDSPDLSRFGRTREEVSATIDLFTYRHALLQLETKAKHAAPSLLICPINISTVLRSRYRSAFLEEEVPAAAKEFLVFRAQTFVEPFSRIKVFDTAGYLRARCRALIADVTLTAADFSVLKQAGFQSVGIDMPESNGVGAVLKHGDNLVSRARKTGLRSFITGVNGRDDASVCLQAGFSYISGPWFADD